MSIPRSHMQMHRAGLFPSVSLSPARVCLVLLPPSRSRWLPMTCASKTRCLKGTRTRSTSHAPRNTLTAPVSLGLLELRNVYCVVLADCGPAGARGPGAGEVLSVDHTSGRDSCHVGDCVGGRLCLVWAYQVRSRLCGHMLCDLKAAGDCATLDVLEPKLIEGTQSQQLIAH